MKITPKTHGTVLYMYARNFALATLCAIVLKAPSTQGCTDVMVPPDPTELKQVVSARTLDGPLVDVSGATEVKLQAFERDRDWRSNWTQRGNGIQWSNPYGFVGMHAMKHVTDELGFGLMMFDGLNEHGLSAGFLWLWVTDYPGLPMQPEHSLSIVDTVPYILGNFKTVTEVKAALTDPKNAKFAAIWAEPAVRKLAPLHLIVRDLEGKSLLVEWIEGKQLVYDGPVVDDIGVLTNDPVYPQQLKELAKYRKVTPKDGLYGIPGDASMQSRFIRVAMLRRFAFTSRGPFPLDARQVAAHLINSVDVVYGTNIEHVPGENFSFEDYTGPTIIRDHKSRAIYFKGHNNQSYRKIDLAQIDFGKPLASAILADPLPTDPIYFEYQFGQNVTEMLNQ